MSTLNPSAIFPPPAYDGKMRFDIWQIQFDMYVKASNIADENKVVVFLQHMGMDMLVKLVDWLDPILPQTKTYEELVKLVKSQCSSSPNLFASRVKLFTERQAPGQSVQEYIAYMTQLFGRCKLREMSAEDFGILAILRGLNSDDMRQYLMDPEVKKVDDLRTKAMKFEQSRIAAKEVKSRADESTSFGINAVEKDLKCGYCDGVHQRGREYCPAKDKICKNCGKQDHFASVCKSKKLNFVEGHDSEQENLQVMNGIYPRSVLTVTSSKQSDYIKPIKVQVKLNGVDVDFQHDSGAAVTVISKKVWHMIGKPKLHTTEMKLQSYNKMIPVIGNSKIIIQVGKQIKQLWVTVVQQGSSLFGRDWMKAFQMKRYEHYDHRKEGKAVKCDIQKLNTISIIRHTVIRKFKSDMMHKSRQEKLIQGYCKHNKDHRSIPRDSEKSATVIKIFEHRLNEKREAYVCKSRVDSCNQNRMHIAERESSLQKSYKSKSKKAAET
uniref:Uncharacterized protein n=1 Tax=Panagrolaimus sp. ES5 TaxID=591445 RepID=A0AC34G5B9_9BILA